MRSNTCGAKALELGGEGLPEQIAFQPGNVTSSHGGLVNPIQDTGDRGEEVRLENLAIFKEAEGVPREITNSPTKSNSAEFGNTLRSVEH